MASSTSRGYRYQTQWGRYLLCLQYLIVLSLFMTQRVRPLVWIFIVHISMKLLVGIASQTYFCFDKSKQNHSLADREIYDSSDAKVQMFRNKV